MIHKKQYIALAFISLCTPITQAMQQQKIGSSLAASSSSSTTFSAPKISTSPYASMSLEELTRCKEGLDTQKEDLSKKIEHKIAHEWPAQHPCCNCLVGKQTQLATSACRLASSAAFLMTVYMTAPPLSVPFLCGIERTTVAVSSVVLMAISGFYHILAQEKYKTLIKESSADEQTQKEKIEKEHSLVSRILDNRVKAEEENEQRLWAKYKRKKLLRIKEKSE